MRTDAHREQQAVDLLLTLEGVADTYFPRRFRTVTDDEGRTTRTWEPLTGGYVFVNAASASALAASPLRFAAVSKQPAYVGGFQLSIAVPFDRLGADPMQCAEVAAAVRRLVAEAAPAAVELWQGTRLLVWRQRVQRWVFVRKGEKTS